MILGRGSCASRSERCSRSPRRDGHAICSRSAPACIWPFRPPSVARDCPTASTCASGSEGASLQALFDADDDGTITLAELQTSSILMTLLAPDLDLFDGAGAPGHDGTNDALSVGVAFEAVLATFTSPP